MQPPTARGPEGRRRRRFATLVAALAAVGAAGGCDGGEGDQADVPGPEAYTAAIAEFMPPSIDPEQRPVVYLAGLGGTEFSLDDQVAMIDAVADSHDLRFVDITDAAVDDEVDDAPPRDDGLLIGIGTIAAEPPHTVRVEVYNEVDAVEAHLITLMVRNAQWRVETSEPVDPEGLVNDE